MMPHLAAHGPYRPAVATQSSACAKAVQQQTFKYVPALAKYGGHTLDASQLVRSKWLETLSWQVLHRLCWQRKRWHRRYVFCTNRSTKTYRCSCTAAVGLVPAPEALAATASTTQQACAAAGPLARVMRAHETCATVTQPATRTRNVQQYVYRHLSEMATISWLTHATALAGTNETCRFRTWALPLAPIDACLATDRTNSSPELITDACRMQARRHYATATNLL